MNAVARSTSGLNVPGRLAHRWMLAPVSAVLMTLLTWGLFGQLMPLELPQRVIAELAVRRL